MSNEMPYPKITIKFCMKCKWTLRSAWYLQELLQTFGDSLKELSLVPAEVGEFKVLAYRDANEPELLIWDRRLEGGFPDSKVLKQRVRAVLFENSVAVGSHIARKVENKLLISAQDHSEGIVEAPDCPDCTLDVSKDDE